MDKMVPPMVGALLFPVNPVPPGKHLWRAHSLFSLYSQLKVEVLQLCLNIAPCFSLGDLFKLDRGTGMWLWKYKDTQWIVYS